MNTFYVLGRKISRGRHLGATLAPGGQNSLAEVVYGMVRARKRRTAKKGEKGQLSFFLFGDWGMAGVSQYTVAIMFTYRQRLSCNNRRAGGGKQERWGRRSRGQEPKQHLPQEPRRQPLPNHPGGRFRRREQQRGRIRRGEGQRARIGILLGQLLLPIPQEVVGREQQQEKGEKEGEDIGRRQSGQERRRHLRNGTEEQVGRDAAAAAARATETSAPPTEAIGGPGDVVGPPFSLHPRLLLHPSRPLLLRRLPLQRFHRGGVFGHSRRRRRQCQQQQAEARLRLVNTEEANEVSSLHVHESELHFCCRPTVRLAYTTCPRCHSLLSSQAAVLLMFSVV